MNCPQCGATLSENNLFCGTCGAVMVSSVPDPSAEPDTELSEDSPPAGAPATRDLWASAAFVLGLVCLASAVAVICFPLTATVNCLGGIVGVGAVVLGALAQRALKAQDGRHRERRMARLGLVTGLIGTLLHILLYFMWSFQLFLESQSGALQ